MISGVFICYLKLFNVLLELLGKTSLLKIDILPTN